VQKVNKSPTGENSRMTSQLGRPSKVSNISGEEYSKFDLKGRESEYTEYRGSYKENKFWEAWKDNPKDEKVEMKIMKNDKKECRNDSRLEIRKEIRVET
jgi:hypothetical protein